MGNGLVEYGSDGEEVGVGFHVGDELGFGGVFWEVGREIEERELAEAFWEMEFESVVGSLLPQRSYAIASFEDQGSDAVLVEASGHRQPRWPCAYNDRPLMKDHTILIIFFFRTRHCHCATKLKTNKQVKKMIISIGVAEGGSLFSGGGGGGFIGKEKEYDYLCALL